MVAEPTPYDELNGLLAEIVDNARSAFGDGFVGAYLVGSFGVGDADLHSDCDFLVVVGERPAGGAERAVRQLHDEIPTRDGHWPHDLEGSYAVLDDLRTLDGMGRPWLFVDHGHREMQWSDHCNREVVWRPLREKGVVLAGREPRSFVAAVPDDRMRARMRADLPTLLDDVLSWAPTEIAWTQRYVVTTYCRLLHTLVTAEVVSKKAALEWAMEALDERWRPLLRQVRDDRAIGWDPHDPPRPGSLEAAYAFADHCRAWAAGR